MAIIMLAGPIKAWWDEEWNTPAHWHYALWRERVNTELVKSYHLVYRPHEAFQGSWDERAQSINDFVLRTADVIFNLTPPGVPSDGTNGEVLYAANFGKTIIDLPPPERVEDFERALIEMNVKLTELGLSTTGVEQEHVIASLNPEGMTAIEIANWLAEYTHYVKRFHYFDKFGTLRCLDTPFRADVMAQNDEVLKIEVLDKLAAS